MSQPFMQMYVADYLADTQHLSTEQHGAYLLILFAMWRAGGDLDPDDGKLARITRLSVARWNKIKGDVMALLTLESGRLTQKRLRAEIKKAEEKSQKRADAGRSGGHAKALKDQKQGLANASDLPWHSSEPESDNRKKEEESVAPDGASVSRETLPAVPRPSSKQKGLRQEPEGFAEFYEAFPLHKARPNAAKAYATAIKAGCSPADILAGARRYAAERRSEDPKFTAHPATWLNQRRWTDETPKPQLFAGGRNGGQSSHQSFGASVSRVVTERRRGGLFAEDGEGDRGSSGPGDQEGSVIEGRILRLGSDAA